MSTDTLFRYLPLSHSTAQHLPPLTARYASPSAMLLLALLYQWSFEDRGAPLYLVNDHRTKDSGQCSARRHVSVLVLSAR